ncbi:MAG: glycine--tRNA ligase, partial [Planctomycetota bacterium]|nr:glycine--tRNA ligase [Planctomycetota bacterium]
MANEQDLMERIVALAKRRGFIYPSSEIYGGINGFWDYGPLGVELKRNLKDAWWQDIVRCPPAGPDGRPLQMVGLDCSIIMNPKVWEASGHVAGFTDPLLECKACKAKVRADQFFVITFNRMTDAIPPAKLMAPAAPEDGRVLLPPELPQVVPDFIASRVASTKKEAENNPDELLNSAQRRKLGNPHFAGAETYAEYTHLQNTVTRSGWPPVPCPNCGESGTLMEPRKFNLMFKSHAGAMEDSASLVYLRPETAQGIFANYKNVLDTTRIKVPFGIAQIGKAFRNEINPRNFTFRSREFEQMEIEFFCHPSQ